MYNYTVSVGDVKDHVCADEKQAQATFALLQNKVFEARRKKIEAMKPDSFDFYVSLTREQVKKYVPKGADRTSYLKWFRDVKLKEQNISLTKEWCAHLVDLQFDGKVGSKRLCFPYLMLPFASVSKFIMESEMMNFEWNDMVQYCRFASSDFTPHEVDGSLDIRLNEQRCWDPTDKCDASYLCRELYRANLDTKKRKL